MPIQYSQQSSCASVSAPASLSIHQDDDPCSGSTLVCSVHTAVLRRKAGHVTIPARGPSFPNDYTYLVFTTVKSCISECSIIPCTPGLQCTDSCSWRAGRAPAAPLWILKALLLFNFSNFRNCSVHSRSLAFDLHPVYSCVITTTLVWLIVELDNTIQFN